MDSADDPIGVNVIVLTAALGPVSIEVKTSFELWNCASQFSGSGMVMRFNDYRLAEGVYVNLSSVPSWPWIL